MPKQKKSKNKNHSKIATNVYEKGFDLGDQMKVMALSSLDFNQALSEAGVFACAYGYQQVSGFSRPIPSVTLVGTDANAFERAFNHFKDWGCEADGDAVDVQLLLKRDGTYQVWIGPEVERLLYRTVPQEKLYQPIIFSLTWVKPFDTTNPMVSSLEDYCKSSISPVAISVAIGNPKNPDINSIQDLNHLPKLVKFELKIVRETAAPNDLRFKLGQSQSSKHSPPMMAPSDYCRLRKQTLDVAFPVSRERVRRSELFKNVLSLPGYGDISESQVVQAAINLMLSDELFQGDCHFSKISEDLSESIWKHIASRTEYADSAIHPSQFTPTVVARQIELDIMYLLHKHGFPLAGKNIKDLQAFFRRKGYVDD